MASSEQMAPMELCKIYENIVFHEKADQDPNTYETLANPSHKETQTWKKNHHCRKTIYSLMAIFVVAIGSVSIYTCITVQQQSVNSFHGSKDETGPHKLTKMNDLVESLKGDSGVKGNKGEAGLKGSRGDAGLPGQDGLPGQKGATGVGRKGDKGDLGEPGIQGEPGPRGRSGISGDKGDKGQRGKDGTKGDNGARGDNGAKGNKGARGVYGSDGQKGMKGDRGDEGVDGQQGNIGPRGYKGNKGQRGDRVPPNGPYWQRNLPDYVRGIRLRGGSATRGRVEVYLGGVWSTICDDSFKAVDARVACRQLGLTGDDYFTSGGGSGNIGLDNMNCTGTEAALVDCGHIGVNKHNCDHDEDVGVECRYP